MPVCEGFEKCTFFKEHMNNLQSAAALAQAHFCKKDYLECARYRVYKELGESSVPSDLSPNEKVRADEILAAARG